MSKYVKRTSMATQNLTFVWSDPHRLDKGAVRFRPLAEHVGPHNPSD